MTTKSKTVKKPVGETVVVSRLVSAPCELVYRAWTEPKQMVQWFSPEDIECRSVQAKVIVGGAFRIHMAAKDRDHVATGKYLEVTPERRLRFSWEWKAYAMPESVITIDFEDLGAKTRVTLTHAGLPDKSDATDHKKGWTSALRKFARLMQQKKIK